MVRLVLGNESKTWLVAECDGRLHWWWWDIGPHYELIDEVTRAFNF